MSQGVHGVGISKDKVPSENSEQLQEHGNQLVVVFFLFLDEATN